MVIDIFNDNRTMYDYAVNYFKDGLPGQPDVVADGALPYFSIANFTEATGKTLMQMQDQEGTRPTLSSASPCWGSLVNRVGTKEWICTPCTAIRSWMRKFSFAAIQLRWGRMTE